MIVSIDHSIFESATTDERKMQLSFLLYLLVNKTCYTLSLQDDVTDTAFYKEQPGSIKDVIDDAFMTTIMSSTNADCFVGVGYESEEIQRKFSLQEAMTFLMEPSSIVLENALNDAYFIDALFRCYDDTGKMRSYVKEGWLQYDNAGGCGNIQNFLQARVNHYQGKTKFLKCYVIVDGDKLYPKQEQNKYNNLEKKLEEWGVGIHILEKRTMENYMPMLVLRNQTKSNQREWVSSYEELSPVQRDYLSIGGGFSYDEKKKKKESLDRELKRFRKRKSQMNDKHFVSKYMSSGRKELYSNVSNGNFCHLALGFPVNGVFKDTYPKLYQSPLATRAGFDAITSHQTEVNELRTLVESLIKII